MADGSVVIDTRILDDGFNRGMKGLRSVARAGGIAIAASIGVAAVALGAYAVASVNAAQADAVANKRIEAVATSMGLYGDETAKVSKRLQDLATATALQTGVDDLAIKATQAKLLTFRELAKTADETGGAFDRATQAAIDLAAAGFGSAEQNAVQLGKALQDPVKGITALARSGVTFTAQEKDKIATLVESNKTLEAQELVLKAIETQVGGTAAATASSSERIKVAFGELQEAAGAPLLSVFDALTPSIINSMTGLQPAFAETFGGLADILSGKDGGSERMQAGIQTLVGSLGKGLETALPILITALTSVVISLAQAIPSLLMAIIPPIIDGILAITEALPEIIPALVDAFEYLIQALAAAVPEFAPQITEAFLQLVMLLATVLGENAPMIIETMAAMLNQIADVLFENEDAMAEAGIALFMGILSGLAQAAPEIIRAIWNLAVTLLSTFAKYLGIKSPSTKFADAGKNIIDGLINGVKSVVSKVTDFFRELPGKIIEKMGDLKDKFLTAGKDIVAGIRQGIEDKWEGLKTKLRSLASALPDVVKKVLGIKSPSRVFAEEVGAPSADGIAMGFTDSMKAVYRRMQASVNSEMGRFASVVTPRAQSQTQAAAVAGGLTVNFNQPVRTYSEVVMATRELGVAIARG